jgi:hypothetical protein
VGFVGGMIVEGGVVIGKSGLLYMPNVGQSWFELRMVKRLYTASGALGSTRWLPRIDRPDCPTFVSRCRPNRNYRS